MSEKFKNLFSRKFLMAMLSVVVGILTMFGVADGTVEVVSSIGLILIPTIIYIVTEGKIDAIAVKLITETVNEIVDVIEEEEGE